MLGMSEITRETKEALRPDFEKWARTRWSELDLAYNEKLGGYNNPECMWAWLAWWSSASYYAGSQSRPCISQPLDVMK